MGKTPAPQTSIEVSQLIPDRLGLDVWMFSDVTELKTAQEQSLFLKTLP